MCSVVQDEFVSDAIDIEPPKPTSLNSQCKKCLKESASIVLQKRHTYCRSCFIHNITHKFRSTLGKTKLMKFGEKVLVMFYGDQNSIALLHLLEQGMAENAHKKLRFVPIILFVDESVLWSKKLDRSTVYEDVKKSLKSSFDCYVIKLSSVYGNYSIESIQDMKYDTDFDTNDQKLFDSFSTIKGATSKLEFIVRLRYLIQVNAAKQLQCDKIFTPESATDLSVKLLSDVILGRGSQIPSDTGIFDNRYPDLCCLRPLREITAKEIAFYNTFNELEFPPVPSVVAMFGSNESLQQVTQSFVYELQEEFPSTVYTIFHTGDKLKIPDVHNQNICVLCHNRIDASNSKQTSTVQCSDISQKNCKNCTCSGNKFTTENLKKILPETLCYGCNRLANELKTPESIPLEVLEKAKLKLQAEEMRSKIEDFLL